MKAKPTTPKRKYSRLTPTAWAEIEAHWQTGEQTLEDLSAQYGVTTRTLQAHFKKHAIVKGEKAKEIAAAAHAAVIAENLDDRQQRERLARDARWKAFAIGEEIETVMAQQVAAIKSDPSLAPRAMTAIKA